MDHGGIHCNDGLCWQAGLSTHGQLQATLGVPANQSSMSVLKQMLAPWSCAIQHRKRHPLHQGGTVSYSADCLTSLDIARYLASS